MKKRQLEQAIALFDNIPGCSFIDNYAAKLSREELHELSRFLKFVFDDISRVYDNNDSTEYIESLSKEYVCQMSETHQCIFNFCLENESGRSIDGKSETDISMRFRSYEKSTWNDQFKITGEGFKEGIDIDEYKNWDLLLRFIVEKHIKNSKPAIELNKENLDSKLEAIQIKMIDLSDIGNIK